MYLWAPIIANFREYDEKKVQECIIVDKYLETLKHEVFFTSSATLI